MKKARSTILAFAAIAMFVTAGAQAPIARGRAPGGEPYLMGGVGQEEVALIQVARPSFSLSVRTATRSGAFLADVHLRIVDTEGKSVFDQDLAGPWLLIDLRPGRYTLEGSRGGEVQRHAVTVPAGGRRDLMLYFENRGEAADPAADPLLHPPAAR